MSTFVDITGSNYPKIYNGDSIVPMRGISLLPVLRGEALERNGALFWNWKQGSAVRLDDWKIVKLGENNSWELYNMKNDPCENNNLALKFPIKVSELNQLYKTWITEYN